MASFRYTLLKGVPCTSVDVEGRHLTFTGQFVIDTGAYMTIIRTPRIDAMGYTARDATKRFATESVIGKEEGYCLQIESLIVFGKRFTNCEVAALDLPERYHIDGLIGMNLLSQLRWCVYPDRTRIFLPR